MSNFYLLYLCYLSSPEFEHYFFLLVSLKIDCFLLFFYSYIGISNPMIEITLYNICVEIPDRKTIQIHGARAPGKYIISVLP